MQVTIPKRIAERTGIRPGDAVIFEETPDDRIVIKKVSGSSINAEKVVQAFDDLAGDMNKIKGNIDEAESGLIEGLSRHIRS
jgi:AbrB family looped-hinge helix DNA binding protein